jgi:type II secretory pathway pseudopilin PulG
LAKSCCSEAGFSLAEVAVATGILATVSLGVAQMFALSTEKNLTARQQVSTTTMATQKMEQLRGLTFSYDASGLGLPVTDTTTNLALCTPDATGSGLNPSPTDSLEENRDGFVDYLDARGNCVGTGTAPPAGSVFTRRWSILPLPTNPNNTLVLTVLVTPTAKEQQRVRIPGTARVRQMQDAMLISVRTRKAP